MSAARTAVTGATGFVGRALVDALRRDGGEVLALDRSAFAGGPDAAITRIVDFAPTSVVHLATHFVARHEAGDIPAIVRANVEVSAVVAEAATRAGAVLVCVGTAWEHYEGRDYDPVSLYAATKRAGRDLVEYYVRAQGLVCADAVLFDTYGPGDTRPKLVPALLDAAQSGATLEMSDGHQLIDLIYIDDVVAALTLLAAGDVPAAPVVLRTWAPVTVREVVAAVEQATGRTVDVRWGARPSRGREMTTDWAFGSRLPGWAPTVPLVDGLAAAWRARASHP